MHTRRLALAFLLTLTHLAFAQVDPARFAEMRWRHIGPFRGGRTVAAVGIPSQPNVFFIGVNNGGVWKTTDYGRVWTPVFDDQPTGSIGAIAIAPSNPDVIYVGSGEGLHRPDLSTGNGIYKSTDGGRSWTHLGLRDGQQIPMIAVDPKNPDRLFVAVLGHPYGPNKERGIFRSLDGGKTFENVLHRDEDTGAIDVIIDPSNAGIVYAALWEARQGPWENGAFTGPGTGVYKSTDGGTTWRPLTNGLPSGESLGRAGLEVAQSNSKRLYMIAGTKPDSGGLYRSDDGGETWTRINTDSRLWGRPGDFNEVRADPKNADVVYVGNIVTWKSIDGGKTFTALRGAPGGDDYHRIWINPNDPNIILNASDQGAVITVNGGATWSSWYNQPTAQMFHINADNAFPYRVCGGQQESGSACVPSRGDEGQITFRDWTPVGVEEYGYAVPDPLDPDIVYGGRITRYDRRTRLAEDVTPKPLRSADYRVVRTQPSIFSPADPRILYYASNTLWRTANGGKSWTQISPDLTRKEWAVPANVGKYIGTPAAQPRQRGVIYTIAPSPLNVNRIWIGTDDGLIHVTASGGTTWSDVTPKELVPWAKVSILEASHFDESTAYAAINTLRLDDLRPHIYRTRDGGKTWTHITNGIPDGATVNVVREDHKRRGLLFAGTENEVYFSIDDGEHWQSLRLNMPASSIRDLIVKDDDVAVATHGRGFWILDDIEPLRQTQNIRGAVHLFAPQRAWRFRWNKNTDTPLPADEPAGQNPPEGAILDYYLGRAAKEVTLEILGARGETIRRYVSWSKPVEPADTGNVPAYWIRPELPLPVSAGMHRVTWDLRHTPAPETPVTYPIAAVPFNTPPAPTSPLAMPGTYTVRLIVDGETLVQPLTLDMDPRVKTPREGLQSQFDESMKVYAMLQSVEEMRKQGDSEERAQLADTLRSLLDRLQSADTAPSDALVEAVKEMQEKVLMKK
jgi:photosystem II stability/assembly factor-like uncharacterized protein